MLDGCRICTMNVERNTDFINMPNCKYYCEEEFVSYDVLERKLRSISITIIMIGLNKNSTV